MYGIEGIDELKDDFGGENLGSSRDEWKSDNPPVDITKVSDEAGVRLDEAALLVDVFGEEVPDYGRNDQHDTEVSDLTKRVIERMADEVHQAWCEWMQYLFSEESGWTLMDGGFKLDAESVKRWKRQMNTPYAELPEEEKESERRIAQRYLSIDLLEDNNV